MLWARRLVGELGWNQKDKFSTVFTDNKPMYHRMENPIRSFRKRYMRIKYWFMQQLVSLENHDQLRELTLKLIPSKDNWSDCWTKVLKLFDFRQQRKVVLNLDDKQDRPNKAEKSE